MITVTVEPPVDRDVTITMKESEAEILRALVGGVIHLVGDKPAAVFLRELFFTLVAVGIGEETPATYSDFFTGDPAVR